MCEILDYSIFIKADFPGILHIGAVFSALLNHYP